MFIFGNKVNFQKNVFFLPNLRQIWQYIDIFTMKSRKNPKKFKKILEAKNKKFLLVESPEQKIIGKKNRKN